MTARSVHPRNDATPILAFWLAAALGLVAVTFSAAPAAAQSGAFGSTIEQRWTRAAPRASIMVNDRAYAAFLANMSVRGATGSIWWPISASVRPTRRCSSNI